MGTGASDTAHLYVICGHGAGDSGAVGGGYTEAERVRALGKRIKELGGDAVTLHDTGDNAYASGAIARLSIPGDWQIVELHMDSATGSARGGHVIIKGGFEPDEYDNKLAALVSRVFPGRSKSIVGRSDLTNPNRAAKRGYGYRLVENGFISNATDRSIFNSSIDELARGYLEAFGIAATGGGAASASSSGDKSGTGFGGTYRCTVDSLNVRDSPSLSGGVVATYKKGQTVVLDDWYRIADGWVWGRYTGASSGKKRYVAVGKPTGGPAAGDYLVKV